MGVEQDVEKLQTDLEEVIKEAMKCKLDVYTKIEEFSSVLEATSVDRANYNHILNTKIDSLAESHTKLYDWFAKHDTKEMEKYDEFTKAITDLTETLKTVMVETEEHSTYIKSKTYNEKLESSINDGVRAKMKKYEEEREAEHKATKELVQKAKITAIGVVTTAVVVGIWKVVMLVATGGAG